MDPRDKKEQDEHKIDAPTAEQVSGVPEDAPLSEVEGTEDEDDNDDLIENDEE